MSYVCPPRPSFRAALCTLFRMATAAPDSPTAGSFRPASSAVDALKGTNLLSIVIELPTSQLTSGGTAKLGLWGTISR